MKRDAEHFGEQELVNVFVARKLKVARRLEQTLTDAGVDFAVEADEYTAGFILRTTRIGAFFYVAPEDESAARDAIARGGFKA